MTISDNDDRVQTICLLILTMLAIGAALYWLQPVLVPFVLAVFVALTLTPLVDLLVRRLHLPHPVAVIGTLVIVFLLFVVVSGIVTNSLAQLAANASTYTERLEKLIDRVAEALPLEKLGFDWETKVSTLSLTPAGSLQDVLLLTTNSLMGILSQGMLVLIFVLFILFGAKTRQQPVGGVWGEVESRVKRYITTKVLLSAVTGITVSAILALLNVDFAMAFGFLAFVLNFIPSIGSIIATLLPLPLVILAPDVTLTRVVLVIALPGAVQFGIGNVLEPKILGSSLDLHPIVILLMLIFWGMLWGTVGMLLATPITAMLKLILERIPYTAPVAEILAGRLDALQTD